MHTAVLVFALVWHSVAPLCITPGMTRPQVEMVLGKADGYIGLGLFGQYTTPIYRSYPNLCLCYGPDDRVESVEYGSLQKLP